MTSYATITFSQTGVQPPVYVTTSLSEWTPLEMDVEADQTASGNLVFSKGFSDVAEGSYQYKIRIGEDHWVLDESKETATDDQGFRNNVIQVKPQSETDSTTSASDATTVQEATSDTPLVKASPALPTKLSDTRKDSTIDQDQLPDVPVPVIVVEKVADQDPPAYGDVEHVDLPADAAKRTADAEPDFEEVNADTPGETEPPKSSDVPLVVVEKTEDRPAYGDDQGKDATNTQKAAHDMRTADASPDKLVIKPESPVQSGDQNEQAPLFRHESLQAEEPPTAPSPSMGTISEESVQSSTDQTSSGDAMDTPPEPDEAQGSGELDQAPLLRHETGSGNKSGKLGEEALLPHEADAGGEGHADKLDKTPMFSHETGLRDADERPSDGEEDELNRFPLMSHETGFSDYKGSEIHTNSDLQDDEDVMEPQHYGPYEDEEEYPDGDDGDAPLLPHERDSALASNASSDFSADDAPFSLNSHPTLGYETDNANTCFGASGRSNMFRARTNSSNLPHKLPQSDAEDENLNDPSLERFPTSREQILERVATIGLHLPEDEIMHDHPHSPQMSVLSQACSSVDLVPVKSYTSLPSVPEAEDSDDEEEENQDVESLPSPVFIGQNTSRMSNPPPAFARDPQATPIPDKSKQLDIKDNKSETPNSHTAESSEADSVDRNDGAKDVSHLLSTLSDAVSAPTRIMKPTWTPATCEPKTTAKENNPVSDPDSEVRKRRAMVEDSAQTSETVPTPTDGAPNKDKLANTLAQQSDTRNENLLQNFFRVVFGSVGRFLTACVGDRKRAR
ncbi:hypothetical protein BDW02DRAFT_606964 [Decorospora gaudefroyi]|uniref:AMP-activated protein kinase glycogen-binding domain-containing protein n=1 Tax=Decorospora gaudefroyi TaxID=184978 RepID=A0A6A5K1X3_9PLEO|nr:hypothetical protein BDW02DRAFT_606964 [Decorospora gaudefroyi]